MYEHVKDPDYLKAETRQAQVITGYRAAEAKKLRSYGDRETRRRPADEAEFAKLFANRVARIDNPQPQQEGRGRARGSYPSPNSRSNSPGDRQPKRRRNQPKQGCRQDRGLSPPGKNGPQAYPKAQGTTQTNPQSAPKKQGGAQPSTSKGKAGPGLPPKGKSKGKGQYKGPKKPYMPKGQPEAKNDQLLRALCQAWLQDRA